MLKTQPAKWVWIALAVIFVVVGGRPGGELTGAAGGRAIEFVGGGVSSFVGWLDDAFAEPEAPPLHEVRSFGADLIDRVDEASEPQPLPPVLDGCEGDTTCAIQPAG